MHVKAVRNQLICSIVFNMFTITEFVRSECRHVERYNRFTSNCNYLQISPPS